MEWVNKTESTQHALILASFQNSFAPPVKLFHIDDDDDDVVKIEQMEQIGMASSAIINGIKEEEKCRYWQLWNVRWQS